MDPLGASAPQAQPAAPAGPSLQPLQVTTAQVGQMWGQLASERKVVLRTSIASCQELMQRLGMRLNAHPVEIIGSEGIAAGQVVPSGDPCFLHGKLSPQRLELLVRTRDAGVAQGICDFCA